MLGLVLWLAAAPVAPSPALSPAEELATFRLQDGFRAELVASEPMVQDPVALSFDEEGRIWVVEMRGFMPRLDRKGEDAPVGRISVLEDTDDDGRADRATVFLEGLVMPRAVAVVSGGALVVHDRKLWMAHDRDGDLRADDQTLIDPAYITGRNPEHQANGLLRALDNWYYSAKSAFRHRRAGDGWIKQKTEFRGQWGMTQDDHGRLYYNYNFDQLRADIVPPNTIARNPNHQTPRGINVQVIADQSIFPARPTTGVNRGYRPGILDENGRLRTFASSCAPVIYRGDAYPPGFAGNAFVCDPSANLVKRNLVRVDGLGFASSFAYPDADFFTSTDERFRPVNAHLAPDGTIYVVDMYRGIIQHGEYISPYLRREILARGLEAPIHLGRIWRLLPPGGRRGLRPRLSHTSTADLVRLIAHPNGWWRDTAQRLLVERRDTTATPALVASARNRRSDPRARLHALWTLEGVGGYRPERLLPLVRDASAAVASAAIRVLEPTATASPALRSALLRRLDRAQRSAGPEVQLQIALTAGALTRDMEELPLLARIAVDHGAAPLVRDAVLTGLVGRELETLRLVIREPKVRDEESGLAPMLQALASAVVREGRPARVEALLALTAAQQGSTRWRRRPLVGAIVEHTLTLEAAPLRFARRPAGLAPLAEDLTIALLLARALPLLAWPGHEPPRPATPPPAAPPPTSGSDETLRTGEETYLASCGPCHGVRGEGIEPMAPPLVGSEWVNGPPERLVRIVLMGLEGPVHVRGQRYEPPRIMPAMPAVQGFADEILCATLTYIRRAFGPGAPAVRTDVVRATRDQLAGRQAPYTEEELMKVDTEE